MSTATPFQVVLSRLIKSEVRRDRLQQRYCCSRDELKKQDMEQTALRFENARLRTIIREMDPDFDAKEADRLFRTKADSLLRPKEEKS